MPRSETDRRAFLAVTGRWVAVFVAGGLAQFAAACVPRTTLRPRPAVDPVTSPPDNSILGAQHLSGREWRMRVLGLVDAPLTLTYAQVLALKPVVERVEKMDCVEGFSATFLRRGTLVRDLLARAGVQASAKSVIFRCHDGYSTSFPVEYFRDADAMVVWEENGKPLIAERGYPLELTASGKWGYKWAKWIEVIELSANAGYRGYWESRGYSNSGDRDKAFLGR